MPETLVDIAEFDHRASERMERSSRLSRMAFDRLARRLERSSGRVGALVEDASGEVLFERDADEPFPSASVIKLPLVMACYAEAAAGRVALDDRAAIGVSVEGAGVLRHLRDVADLSLRDLATLVVIVSDNTATNRLIDRVGVDLVNAYLDRWGCPRSRLRRRMYDFAARSRGLENVMTPRESARLLGLLVRGEVVDRATSDAVLALLHASQEEPRLRRFLPEGVWVGNKTGTDEGIRNDVGVIRAKRTVAVAGFAKDLANGVDGEDLLAVLGWCAYRAAGGEAGESPQGL